AGSFVILLAQPYRANVKCLFEAQHYPDRRIYPGGPAEQPYDVAGWTLPMQMGVDYTKAGRAFAAALEPIDLGGLTESIKPSNLSLARGQKTRHLQVSGLSFIPSNENDAYNDVNALLHMS